ncbi:MAG: DUF2815 family protein [Brockia lithotrophica]|nr:DUF2815 family protein [Brockia lithotrophica]
MQWPKIEFGEAPPTRNETTVITGVVRFDSINLFTPRMMSEDREPAYTATIIIPKDDVETLRLIGEAIHKALVKGKEKLWGNNVATNVRLPLRDGDVERPENSNYAGCYFIHIKNKDKPPIVDRDGKTAIEDPTQFYSGVFGRAIIRFYPYSTDNKGVGCILQAAQKVADGPSIDPVIGIGEAFED